MCTLQVWPQAQFLRITEYQVTPSLGCITIAMFNDKNYIIAISFI